MTTSTNNTKLSALQVRINRLQARKAVLAHKLAQADRSNRKARTRSLIQMGGLLSMVGLPSRCDIKEGEDLQLDLTGSDKAAVLLGMLVHLNDSLPEVLSDTLLAQFQQKGVRFLKNHTIQKARSTSRSTK